jgi:hypothetical protein
MPIGGLVGAWNQVPSDVVVPWYLSDGIPAANCLAAYQPKGAASLAASYDNLAAPGNGLPDGTYDAALGVAPTWDAVNGWIFNGSTQYLKTGIVPAAGWSFFVRFSGTVGTDRYIFGSYPPYMCLSQRYASKVIYGAGSFLEVSPYMTSGNIGVAGQQGYRNGIANGVIPASETVRQYAFYIASLNWTNNPYSYYSGNIQAIAIYNITLSGPQITALNTAMAAL